MSGSDSLPPWASIIIPNLNSPVIGRVLEALHRQSTGLERVEILVVGADAPGLVVEDPWVRFLSTGRAANAPTNRNVGMQEARGELFLFLDADCIPEPDWLRAHRDRHAAGEQVVGGAVTFGRTNYLQLADNVSAFYELLPFTCEGQRPYLCTANLSVRRAVVEKAGRMDERLDRADDLEWTVRFRAHGYRLYFDPRARIYHDPPRRTMRAVWPHWTEDARDTLAVRLRYRDALGTPRLAGQRWFLLVAAPFIALWATARTFRSWRTWQYGHTLPLVYLTKLAWCWGAFRYFARATALARGERG